MVIWIIGMSTSGKTSTAKILTEKIKQNGRKVILLDGDLIRELFHNDVDHTIGEEGEMAIELLP